MSCKCSSCGQSINPYIRISAIHQAGLEALIEKLLGLDSSSSSSSSSSSPLDLTCLTYEEFYNAISELIALIDEDHDDDDTSPVFSGVNSPVGQMLSSWSAQALNDFCNMTGMEGYSAPQLSMINTVLREITRTPPDLLGCYISTIEDMLTQSAMSTEEKKPLYMACAAAKGSVQYWTEKAAVPGLWAPVLSTDLGVRTARVPYMTKGSFHGAVTVAAKSLTMLPPLSAAADVMASITGSVTVSAATVVLKATPGMKI